MNNLLRRIKIKLKDLLSPNGLVTPNVSKETWENQYSSGAWDYLETEQEKEHYDIIIDFLKIHADTGGVFDVGCGKGVLYNYMEKSNALVDRRYYGIDISENAIKASQEMFGKELFGVLDYQKQSFNEKFNCVIFNETLYYFDGIENILEKCFNENLVDNGIVIISMVKYAKHYLIWDIINNTYQVLDERTVSNQEGNSWTIKAIARK